MNDQRISDCKMGRKKSAEMNSLKNSTLPKWQAHIITIWKETIFIVKFFPKSDKNQIFTKWKTLEDNVIFWCGDIIVENSSCENKAVRIRSEIKFWFKGLIQWSGQK